jgi:hypothetical protein
VSGKSKKEKKPRTPARFATGAMVRVKPGTTDPDFPDIPLGGWAGTIRDVDQRSAPPIYLIEWNQYTLDHMHPIYRKRCERDGLELESMWLGPHDRRDSLFCRLVDSHHQEGEGRMKLFRVHCQ